MGMAAAGFYRFLPTTPGTLHLGGKLQMLKIAGRDDLGSGVPPDQVFDVEWVEIEDPTQAHSSAEQKGDGVYAQGKQAGASTFKRLEGCWHHKGLVYFSSTDGGDAKQGQVWVYSALTNQLRLVFESPGSEVLEAPDNLTVSPRGGILVCEDGVAAGQRMHGLSVDGRIFPFAENNVRLDGERNGIRGDFRDSEWAGCSFSSDGKWLFVNLQTPGITFAITGPWQQGLL
jgi:hypothetical protein